ncbi:MAG: hypothetical protein RMM98_03035 [Acidobacteriota bacterium]|nr:hypothetical protein [Blastocatellia bacterium]MDW8238567.1 hypothetical protein [Acidobacteriota bacterium]
MDKNLHSSEQNGHAHETTDVQIRPLVIFGIGLAVLTVIALLAMWLTFDRLQAREASKALPPSPLAGERPPTPEPRLQVTPEADLERWLAAEREKLNSYGWVNREAGIVRIPIDRAIELIAERGLPTRAESHQAAENQVQQAQGTPPAQAPSRSATR